MISILGATRLVASRTGTTRRTWTARSAAAPTVLGDAPADGAVAVLQAFAGLRDAWPMVARVGVILNTADGSMPQMVRVASAVTQGRPRLRPSVAVGVDPCLWTPTVVSALHATGPSTTFACTKGPFEAVCCASDWLTAGAVDAMAIAEVTREDAGGDTGFEGSVETLLLLAGGGERGRIGRIHGWRLVRGCTANAVTLRAFAEWVVELRSKATLRVATEARQAVLEMECDADRG